jgi:hypothetical protein
MAYGIIEPWGPQSDEWRAGMIAATVANSVRDNKLNPTPYQPADFMRSMFKNENKDEILSDDLLTQKIDLIMAAFGGKRGNPG